jgi:hypothetical protein
VHAPQRCHRWKSMNDVSHGAQPDDKEAKLGFVEQGSIFS